MLTLIKLPFKIIGWLLGVIFKLITAIVLPVATFGGVGYLGYSYLKGNPEKAEKLKNAALNKVRNIF